MASGSTLAVWAALVGNLLIAIAKLSAGLASGSSALMAEAVHSFSDVGNQVLLLVGIRRAAGPPTAQHPFGKGKSAYFWPFVVAMLLFGVAGAYSLWEGIEKVRHPHPVEHVGVSLVVLAVAFVIEAFTLAVAVRAAKQGATKAGIRTVRGFVRRNREANLITVIVEDSLALVGLPIAGIAIALAGWTGNGVWDGLGSMVIGVLLMGFALFLAREVHDLLLGEGLDAHDLARVREITDAHPEIVRFQNVRSMFLGPNVAMLGAEVVLRDDISLAEGIAAIEAAEGRIRAAVPALRYVYLEPEHGEDDVDEA